MYLVVLSLLLVGPFFGCANQKSLRNHKGSYLESVKLNFDAGTEALDGGEYEKAINYFQFVRSKYPFSQYAALSDLKIADTKFAQERWVDAASAYEVFVRLHPRHEQVPYASYRIGLSYFHAVPKDFFILPSATSRDQSFTKEALQALDQFLLNFPQSEQVKEALEKQALLFSYLAQHSMHIADYYERRDKYDAAVERFLSIERDYPNQEVAAIALLRAALIVENKLNDHARALEIYQKIIENKPNSSIFKEAEEHYNKLYIELYPDESEEVKY